MATNSEIEKLERRWLENPLGLTFASLAEAYRKSGEAAKALETLEVGLAQHPNYVPAHIVRGRCHLDAGDHTQAELAFGKVIELDPENPIALKGLADLAESEGRLPEAAGRLEALLEVDRNNEEARGQLDHVRELMSAPAPEHSQGDEPLDAALLPPSRTVEFQLPDDARDLSPSDDRYPEILLQAEVSEDLLPVPEAAQGGDSLVSLDARAAQGLEAAELPERHPSSSTETDGVSDLEERPVEPEPEPAPAVEMEPEPVTAGTGEPEPVHAMSAEAEPSEEPESSSSAAEPELMVTETMAEIFLRQGHRELALAVYSQLAQREPGNERVAAAFSRLQSELVPPAPPTPPPAAPAAEAPSPRRSLAAAATGGRSVGELFASVLRAERPSVTSAIHPPAFEPPRGPSGEPTRPAPESLSLSAVFGEEAAPAGPAGAPPEPGSAEPSFEQFFTPAEGSTAEVQLPKPPNDQAVMSSLAPEDLEQFNAWLRGLKR
ncbi:MAG TPA: tetratricopeptide repeat protein [Gemmatimonadales bacterium]|jgi:tetratricopeptide (TPR) repeat protein|nr:tetratricopeptide repeat protein [Gemmatimonadales bacterium]